MYENLVETLRFCAKDGDCHDCPAEWECTGTMGDGQIAANRKKPRWIPVTERLPDGEAWDRVLVYTDEGNIQTAPKCKVGNGWITHWMPLTEPPKEEA